MTYDEWFRANGNKGNWGGYNQYVMNQTGATQQVDGGAYGAGWSGQDSPDQTGQRALAQKHGRREDLDRYNERTLNEWQQHLDSRCPPHAPYAAINGTGCVEKPIDTNYNAQNAGYIGVQAGEKGYWYGPNGERRSFRPQDAGQPQQPVGPNAQAAGGFNAQDPLQQRLMEMVGGQQGFFGQNPMNNAAALKGGGVWWGQGADFSQQFNPLAPQGAKKAPGGGGGQPANPFQQAATQPQQSPFAPQTQAPSPFQPGAIAGPPPNLPQYKQDMLFQQQQARNPSKLNQNLMKFYG
jgi:hypothetical protein